VKAPKTHHYSCGRESSRVFLLGFFPGLGSDSHREAFIRGDQAGRVSNQILIKAMKCRQPMPGSFRNL
jgi:hypothetical protein